MPSPPIEFAQEADATAEDAIASESPSWDSRDYMSSKSELEGDAEQLDALDGGTYEQCAASVDGTDAPEGGTVTPTGNESYICQ